MKIPIPGLKQEVGAGEVVKAAADSVGVEPCGGCQKRRELFNRALQFIPVMERWVVERARTLGDRHEVLVSYGDKKFLALVIDGANLEASPCNSRDAAKELLGWR